MPEPGPGAVTIGHGTFARGYSDYAQRRRVTNHLEHKPGQAMGVGWSGSTVRLADPGTGEVSKAYLFVAVLPYSQHAYVGATPDMRERAWLVCFVNLSFHKTASVRFTRQREGSSRTSVALAPILSSPTTPRA